MSVRKKSSKAKVAAPLHAIGSKLYFVDNTAKVPRIIYGEVVERTTTETPERDLTNMKITGTFSVHVYELKVSNGLNVDVWERDLYKTFTAVAIEFAKLFFVK